MTIVERIKNLPTKIKLYFVILFVVFATCTNTFISYTLFLVWDKFWPMAGTLEKIGLAWLLPLGIFTIINNLFRVIYEFGYIRCRAYLIAIKNPDSYLTQR